MTCCGRAARRVLSIFSYCAIGACALTPEATPPDLVGRVAELDGYRHIDGYQYSEQDETAALERIAWWRRIGGDELDVLVSELLTDSFRLIEARAQARQLAERARQARASRLPSVSGSLDPSYNRTQNLTGEFGWDEAYSLGAFANLNTDIFGGLRATERAARLNAAAAAISYQAALQQEIAALATNWVAAAALKRRLALANAIAESFRATYELTDKRYRTGSASATASGVQIAKQNLDSALVDIPNLEAQLQSQLLAIDEQLARLPGETGQFFTGALGAQTPSRPPIGMPVELLTARPDVAAAELRFRAALEDVGSARANLFPTLTLTASLTFQNTEFSDLFSWDRHLASLAGSLTQPIFQGGRLRSEIRLQQAEADELAAAYGRTTIAALVDVETALVEIAGLTEQVKRLENNVASAELSNQLAQNRYRRGLDTILSVLETQRGLNAARENLILAEQALFNARINLYFSLGGVWFEEAPEQSGVDEQASRGKGPSVEDGIGEGAYGH